jgi:hypothetical protein
MPGCKWIWPTILVLLAAPASAITPEQAQTLPVAELAKLVLGEAGALVVDVDRPKWHVCEFGCEPLSQEQLKRAPPLDRLTFYTRPARGWSSERWSGLCEVDVIAVDFGKGAKVAGIKIHRRWTSPTGMQRAKKDVTEPDLPPGNDECSSVADARSFFEADDPVGLTAFRVLVAAQLYDEAVERGTPLPFKFKCKSDYWECENKPAKAVAIRFSPVHISKAEQVDCADRRRKISSVEAGACYTVDLQLGESLFVEVADALSDLRIKRVEYSHGAVIVD